MAATITLTTKRNPDANITRIAPEGVAEGLVVDTLVVAPPIDSVEAGFVRDSEVEEKNIGVVVPASVVCGIRLALAE